MICPNCVGACVCSNQWSQPYRAIQPNEYKPTKLEYFAGLALQGILANDQYQPPRRQRLADMAEDAANAAKALIAELEKAQ